MKRIKTDYPGVFYRLADRIGGKGQEKIFYVVFKRNGKVIEAKAGRQYKDNITAAKAARYRSDLIEGREQTQQEKRAVEKGQNNQWTISKLWDSYCETHPENKSLRIEQRKFDCHLRKGVGKKEPCELLPLDVDRLRLKMQRQGKHTTAARILELLRRTINYGIKRGLVPPISFKIEIPRLNNQTTEDLSPKQINKLIKVLNADEDQTAANVMRLALFTGMRKSEILKLRWEDVDYRRGFIVLDDPKGGVDMSIPLNDAARSVFESIKRRDENEYVFPGRFPGTHLTDCRKSFARISKGAGFPKGFRPLHGLRHVYGSMMASSGQVDMHVLQRLLTHKSPLMTQRYAHLRDEALKRASGIAADLINQASEEPKQEKVVNIDDHKN